MPRRNFTPVSSGTVDRDRQVHRRGGLLFSLQTSGNSEKITCGRGDYKRGTREEFLLRQSSAPVFFFPPRLLRILWDSRWGRSRNFSKRRARGTWPRWTSFSLGSARLRAPAAGFLGPVEAAIAAATAPPLIRSPVCSGRLGNGAEVLDITTRKCGEALTVPTK